MVDIFILTDYKNQFGSNYDAVPYRSGFRQDRLKELFLKQGFSTQFIPISEVQHVQLAWEGKFVLYTSNEEPGYHFKSYIEDVVLYLRLRKAILIPHYELLRANNNKSFMELYKKVLLNGSDDIEALSFGSLEDVEQTDANIKFPVVFKTSGGAMSSGVRKVNSQKELVKVIKQLSRTANLKQSIKETLRAFKHKGYVKNSNYQAKFVLQPFISGLSNDWKVLIFGEQVYILKRGVRKGDFRASGSHVDYKAGSEAGFPVDKLDSLMEFKNKINIPNLSIDYAYDGKKGYIIEFQGIYFGLSTHNYCKDYYIKEGERWVTRPNVMDKEELFAYSIVHFLKTNYPD